MADLFDPELSDTTSIYSKCTHCLCVNDDIGQLIDYISTHATSALNLLLSTVANVQPVVKIPQQLYMKYSTI